MQTFQFQIISTSYIEVRYDVENGKVKVWEYVIPAYLAPYVQFTPEFTSQVQAEAENNAMSLRLISNLPDVFVKNFEQFKMPVL